MFGSAQQKQQKLPGLAKRARGSSHRFPAFIDSTGMRVAVHVTKAGVVQYRSQSNRKREVTLNQLWQALIAPDLLHEAATETERAARRLVEVRNMAFGAGEGLL